MMESIVSLTEIEATESRIRETITCTPMVRIEPDALPGITNEIFIKFENQQKGGSFKFRGVTNFLVKNLDRARRTGVVTGTGGNHGLAISLSGAELKIAVTVVMPESVDPERIRICQNLGAHVELQPNSEMVMKRATSLAQERDYLFIHPFDSPEMIAGSATLGTEILSQAPEAKVICVPTGGGGLVSGILAARNALDQNLRVVGFSPEVIGGMNSCIDSGRIVSNTGKKTVAESLCPPRVGELPFKFCQEFLDKSFPIAESDIKEAMRFYLKHFGIRVEGAGALSLAGFLKKYDVLKNMGPAVLVVSGSNISEGHFRKLMEE